MYDLYPLVPWLAMVMDMAIGDPRSQWHPVVLVGRTISFWERLFYPQRVRAKTAVLAGGFCVLAVLLTVGFVGGFLMYGAALAGYGVYIAAASLMVYITITPNALARDGNEIADLLMRGDLDQARYKLSWIVGRDTAALDESEVARAAIETVAENITDGILSPLFYFLLFGPMGALLYRAANTMDSMLGYKNERYLYFGRAAARLDDVLNYVPARITAVLIWASAWILGYDRRRAWRMMRRDAAKHPSPNGGYAEATVAGALGIRLGGYNYYQGKPEFREYMGDSLQSIDRSHVVATVRLMYVSTWLMIAAVSLLTVIR